MAAQIRVKAVTPAVRGDEHQQIASEHAGAEVGSEPGTILAIAQHARGLIGLEFTEHMAYLARRCQDGPDVDLVPFQVFGISTATNIPIERSIATPTSDLGPMS
jgi:hypothetical protein